MSNFPPGCSARDIPGWGCDETCDICHKWPPECICPECPICGAQGDPKCYSQHGLSAVRLTWSHTPPTEPGWYWARRRGCHAGVFYFISSGTMTRTDYTSGIVAWDKGPIDCSEFEAFAGPIPLPAEPAAEVAGVSGVQE